jgi:Ribosomal proteins 50S L24/mitochondrial 39S L24
MVVCPSCTLPTRVGHVFRDVKGKKVKVRVCRRDGCGGELDK